MTTNDYKAIGKAELRSSLNVARPMFWITGIFSFFVNLLMLTGSFYMLNVYDRVLGSRSVETLVALSALVVFLYGCMGVLDVVRGRIMTRVASALQARLDRRVFSASLKATSLARAPREAQTGSRDLEAVQRLISSPALMAAFDLPFAPIFFAGIFVFHPWLGYLSLGSAALLVALALMNQRASKRPLEEQARSTVVADTLGQQIRQEAETIQALGMGRAAFDRWQAARGRSLATSIAASELGGAYSAAIRTIRLLVQSAMLGLGAFLVLRGEMSGGAMIAGSILLGRGLAPIEQIVGQWGVVARAREAWGSLSVLLGSIPLGTARTALPRPKGRLELEQVTVVPPGEQAATLRMLSFEAQPGQAIGVIGTSGAGKSTLARAITGTWRAAGGTIRLDGAALDQYDPDVLGGVVGYLPQRVALFEGTIKENIARLSKQPDDAAVVRAAQVAGAHEMILRLPHGYDTRVSPNGGRLSGGQVQRIGLARALYGEPVVVILDEPNSNLDNDGSLALNAAIRTLKERGSIVLVMAHRPAALQECDLILVIENGMRRAFGPKDEVLKGMVTNHRQIQTATQAGGIS